MDVEGLLNEDCVYFPPGKTNKAGQKGYGPPRGLKCKWEDVQDVKRLPNGNEWMSRATIYLSEQVDNEGVLWYGQKDDIVSEDNPFANPGAGLVRATERIKSVDAQDTLYVAYL